MGMFDVRGPWESSMCPKVMIALSVIVLVAGCSNPDTLVDEAPQVGAPSADVSPAPVIVELGKSPTALLPYVPDDDELPDAPRLFSIKSNLASSGIK